ncbi:MAG: hypothetical protein IPK82_34875 [Polyangiaceae bacterium]|nr:hypothetical protein [Polyangiaceae bacterium]
MPAPQRRLSRADLPAGSIYPSTFLPIAPSPIPATLFVRLRERISG